MGAIVSGDKPSLFDTFFQYGEVQDLDLDRIIAASEVIDPIAEKGFQMEKRTLQDLLSNREFDVPEYQRLFSWEKKHNKQLWLDLEELITANRDSYDQKASDVFFGSVYFAVDSGSAKHEVIDGQQRLTSVHLLLRAILEELEATKGSGDIENDAIETLRSRSIQQIESLLYHFAGVEMGDQPRLSLNKHDEAFFDAIIQGHEGQLRYLTSDERNTDIDGRKGRATRIDTLIDRFGIDEEAVEEWGVSEDRRSSFIPVYYSNWKLLEAFEFHKQRVSEFVEDSKDTDSKILGLVNLSNYLQNSYHVGEFEIHEADPAFRMQIFKILNDRGLELTKIDRIRATVVNTFFDEEKEVKKEYIEKWENVVTQFGTDSDAIIEYLAVFLSIIEEEIDQIGDAEDELTNAFATRNLESDIKPRFRTAEQAKPFLDRVDALANDYDTLTSDSLEPKDLEGLASHREASHEILQRLNDQQMDQWRPLVLELYDHASQGTDRGERFYETLELIETLNFRRLLVGEDPNIFQELFLDATHTFQDIRDNREERDPYEAAQQVILDGTQAESTELFGDRFRDLITEARDWNDDMVKALFHKMANQQFRENGTIVDRRLNMDDVHLEHVLPQTPVYDADDPIWLPVFFGLDGDTDGNHKIAERVRRYLDLVQRPDDEVSDDQSRQRDSIKEFMRQGFIDDIGNFLLLRGRDNISASNQPLSGKIVEYYREREDFTSIAPNSFFTPAGAIDGSRLDQLLEEAIAVKDDTENMDAINADLQSYFDEFWTVKRMQQRRVELLLEVLELLQIPQRPDEFDLDDRREEVTGEIRQRTEEEFEKRLSMQSV